MWYIRQQSMIPFVLFLSLSLSSCVAVKQYGTNSSNSIQKENSIENPREGEINPSRAKEKNQNEASSSASNIILNGAMIGGAIGALNNNSFYAFSHLDNSFNVKIFYATDRNINPDSSNADISYMFLNDWSDLKFGTAFVTIPKDHRMGNLEAPRWYLMEFSENQSKHIVLNKINKYDKDSFLNELNQDLSATKEQESFVFIHGYNTTFEDAARRTAQISYDLKFNGPAILYSWPSQGSLLAYSQDEVNADRSAIHLEKFLKELMYKTSAKKVHLIAHSMGNRVLINALSRFSYHNTSLDRPLFNQIILTAPDIDVEVFKDISDKILKFGQRTTIYASDKDEALIASKKFHKYPRVGDSSNFVFVQKDIDTVDVSAVDTSLIGHSYYGDNRTVISDLFYAIRGIAPSDRHGLKRSELSGNAYWIFQP